MDGFAVPGGEAGPLRVEGESRAGAPASAALSAGTAFRISTGAVVPDGTHAVVPVEATEERDGEVDRPRERSRREHPAGGRGRARGRDGPSRRAPRSARLSSRCSRRSARRRSSCARGRGSRCSRRATSWSSPATPLGARADPELERLRRRGAGRARGREVVDARAGGGRPRADHATTLARALDSADVVCVSGGVSVGPHDHVKPALAELGVDRALLGRAPAARQADVVRRRATERSCSGCPGNPVSAMVTFHLFARPAVRALQGADPGIRAGVARLGEPLRRNPKRDQMVRVRLERDDDGWVARPTKAQMSHVLTSMLGADALARVPAGDGDIGRRRADRHRAAVTQDPRPRPSEADRGAGVRLGAGRPGHVQAGGRDHAPAPASSSGSGTPSTSSASHAPTGAGCRRSRSACSASCTRPTHAGSCSSLPPFTLLRFHAPEYETEPNCGVVTWRIDRGCWSRRPAAATAGCGSRSRGPTNADGDEVTARVSSEVANFYPALGGWGWFARIGAKIYRYTQLKIHVLVTNALPALARATRPRAEQGRPAANRDRAAVLADALAGDLAELRAVVARVDAADRPGA